MAFFCPSTKSKSKNKSRQTRGKPLPTDAYVRNREYDDLDDGMGELSLGNIRQDGQRQDLQQHSHQLMEVVQGHFPCSALELPVAQGEIVEFIHTNGSWTYVRAENGADGYIPRRNCRLLTVAEQTDLGYYSDQYRHEEQASPSPISSLVQPYHITNFSQQPTPQVTRASSGVRQQSSFSSTGSSRSSTSHHQQPFERVIEGNNGLYTRGRTANNLHFDTTPNTPRAFRSNTVTSGNKQTVVTLVCGRKCGNNCEHKIAARKTDSSVRTNKNSNHLIKTSVVSTSSGRSVSFETTTSLNPPVVLDINNNNTDEVDSSEIKLSGDHSFELPHTKCGHPELIIIQNYEKVSETDLSVDCGDYAAILNDTKYNDWMYIVNEEGNRGFIPKKCAVKHECHDCHNFKETTSDNDTSNRVRCEEEVVYTTDDLDAMKQLVVTQDYSGKSLDDLYVCVGDIVYMSDQEQAGQNWLWVHSLRLNSSGYIPVTVAKSIDLVQKANI